MSRMSRPILHCCSRVSVSRRLDCRSLAWPSYHSAHIVQRTSSRVSRPAGPEAGRTPALMPPSKFSQSGAGGASSPHSTQLCRVFQALMLLLAEDYSRAARLEVRRRRRITDVAADARSPRRTLHDASPDAVFSLPTVPAAQQSAVRYQVSSTYSRATTASSPSIRRPVFVIR